MKTLKFDIGDNTKEVIIAIVNSKLPVDIKIRYIDFLLIPKYIADKSGQIEEI